MIFTIEQLQARLCQLLIAGRVWEYCGPQVHEEQGPLPQRSTAPSSLLVSVASESLRTKRIPTLLQTLFMGPILQMISTRPNSTTISLLCPLLTETWLPSFEVRDLI